VRAGNYTLHAWVDGVLGGLDLGNVNVTAGKDLDLGRIEWQPIRFGKIVWEIGTPDRNTAEFFKGNGANYWLWGWPVRYGALFPNDIIFTIGKSDPAKDWLFEQMPHELIDPAILPRHFPARIAFPRMVKIFIPAASINK
jgi:rhamnogalacturonan endolyase